MGEVKNVREGGKKASSAVAETKSREGGIVTIRPLAAWLLLELDESHSFPPPGRTMTATEEEPL